MDFQIEYPGAYPMARIDMPTGAVLTVESGAMVSMSPTLEIKAQAKGGILKSLGRKFLTGESFFQSTITANDAGVLHLAPSTPGDMVVLDASKGWRLQKGAFVAADERVAVSSKGQGLKKGLFSKEGFFILEAVGEGQLLCSSYGAIHKIELAPGEEHIVDNGHLVAWNADYNVQKATAGWISSFTSGEGFVCKFTGPGTVYIQTRNLASFVGAMLPFLPTPSSN